MKRTEVAQYWEANAETWTRQARAGAIDIAPTFIRHALETETAEGHGIEYSVADATDMPFPRSSFDFATAFMSIMDMADHGIALCEAARVLRPGGFLQFSILHPCFVPPHRKVIREPDRSTRAIEVGDYFDTTDGRIETFRFENLPEEERQATEPFRVPRFHRTLSGWVELIVEAGLVIERLGEPRVSPAVAKAEPALEDTLVAPIFLHIRARKPRRQ